MPLPTKIPSTLTREPITKSLDPVQYSKSAVIAKRQNISTTGTLGTLMLKYQGAISSAAGFVDLSPRNASIQAIRDEASLIISSRVAPSPRVFAKAHAAQRLAEEAERIKESIVQQVEKMAARDLSRARQRIRREIKNTSLREEMLDVINQVSRNSRLG